MTKKIPKKLDKLSESLSELNYIHGLIISNSDPFDPEFRADILYSLGIISDILHQIVKELKLNEPKNTSGQG